MSIESIKRAQIQDGEDQGEWTPDYERWIEELERDVVQGEFGYEPGEFTVYPDAWRSLYENGLSPRDAFQRALDAHAAKRAQDDADRKANWARIQQADAELLLCHAIPNFFQEDDGR
jgi:hypothetical protein